MTIKRDDAVIFKQKYVIGVLFEGTVVRVHKDGTTTVEVKTATRHDGTTLHGWGGAKCKVAIDRVTKVEG